MLCVADLCTCRISWCRAGIQSWCTHGDTRRHALSDTSTRNSIVLGLWLRETELVPGLTELFRNKSFRFQSLSMHGSAELDSDTDANTDADADSDITVSSWVLTTHPAAHVIICMNIYITCHDIPYDTYVMKKIVWLISTYLKTSHPWFTSHLLPVTPKKLVTCGKSSAKHQDSGLGDLRIDSWSALMEGGCCVLSKTAREQGMACPTDKSLYGVGSASPFIFHSCRGVSNWAWRFAPRAR